jgi:HEAT repeat protein
MSVLGALKKLRDERAIAPVAHLAVSDPDVRIRIEAVTALIGIGSFPASVKAALLQALNDEQLDVRVEAARGLGKIPDDDVIDALLVKLGDPALRVRRNVRNALYTIGEKVSPKVTTLLQSTQDTVVKEGAIILLGVLSIQESIPLIEGLLKGETDPELIRIGNHVLQALKGELKDPQILFKLYLS